MSLKKRRKANPNYKEEAKPSWHEEQVRNSMSQMGIQLQDPSRLANFELYNGSISGSTMVNPEKLVRDRDERMRQAQRQLDQEKIFQQVRDPYNTGEAKIGGGSNKIERARDSHAIHKKLLDLYKDKNLSQFLTENPMTPDEATKKEDVKVKEEDKITKRDIFAKDWKGNMGATFNEWIRRFLHQWD